MSCCVLRFHFQRCCVSFFPQRARLVRGWGVVWASVCVCFLSHRSCCYCWLEFFFKCIFFLRRVCHTSHSHMPWQGSHMCICRWYANTCIWNHSRTNEMRRKKSNRRTSSSSSNNNSGRPQKLTNTYIALLRVLSLNVFEYDFCILGNISTIEYVLSQPVLVCVSDFFCTLCPVLRCVSVILSRYFEEEEEEKNH